MTSPPFEGQSATDDAANEDWYPAWVSMLGMPVWVTDAHGHICYVNPYAESLLGVRCADAIGRPCYELIAARTPSGAMHCEPACPVRTSLALRNEVNPFSVQISDSAGKRHDVRIVVIAAHRDPYSRTHLVHCVVDENRENRVRRYLDRLATRSQSVYDSNHRRYPLTDREKEILQLLAEDKSLHTIADDLYLSYATVRNHVQHILHKLGVHSILEAVAVYLLSED